MKKFISAILLPVLVLALGITASAAEIASGYCGGEGDGTNLTWSLSEDGTLTISGEGKMADYEMFWIDGTRITSAPWYNYREQVKNLVIEEGVTYIGNCALRDFSNISGELLIPESVTGIGREAFYGSHFDGNLIIPGNVKTIGDNAFCEWRSFEYIGTDTIIVSEGVENIGNGAFSFGYFKSVSLPSTLRSLGSGVFSFGEVLNEVTISEDCEYYCIADGIIYTKDMTVLKECLMLKTGEFVIPETVETIEDDAFWNTGLSSVTVSENVKYIGSGAFGRCYYPVYIEGQIDYIGENAFNISTGSSDVYFLGGAPKEVIYNPNNSYMSSFNENINIYYLEGTEGWELDENGLWNGFKVMSFVSNGVVEFDPSDYVASGYCGGDPMSGKNIAWLLDKDGVLTIRGKGAMKDYINPFNRAGGEIMEPGSEKAPWIDYSGDIKKLVIEEEITKIGNYAFCYFGSAGQKLLIPSTVESIGNYAFEGCGFDCDLTIPGSVKTIGSWAFSDWSGTPGELVIEEGTEAIERGAFNNGNFDSVKIPSTVSEIDSYAFRYCRKITSFSVSAESPYYKNEEGALLSKDGTKFIALIFSENDEYTIPETVDTICYSAFGFASVEKIIIPENVKTVEGNVFMGYSGKIFVMGELDYVERQSFGDGSRIQYIYFMGGEPKEAEFFNGVGPFLNCGENVKVYYLAENKDKWTFDENGLWNGYELIEWNGLEPGDANGDGKVTSRDATRILQYLIGSVDESSIELSAADFNGDGNVTSRDATAILRYLIGG